jgi:hypothetical protein
MAAHDEIECIGSKSQLEGVALLKAQALRERHMLSLRECDRFGQNVDTDDATRGVATREPSADLAASATDVGDLCMLGQRVARK